MTHLSPRQIHLDFHTSEHIPGIAADFNAEAFARTVKEASISSMTVFARCHHGWMYYDSQQFPDLVHPHLQNKNLMLEQVRALHAQGLRAPVYITVQWDYQMATTHPEWLVRKQDGSHEGDFFAEPGFYQSLCVNTGYVDYLKAHTAEVCRLLGDELDGIFFDIVGIHLCWCAECRARMKAEGIDMTDEPAVRAFTKRSLERFKAEMTALARQYSDDCTIFYNAGHVGTSTKGSADAYTHFELESLPSGGWGYLHFPLTAHYARKLGHDCMGMTGKFHLSWGDFHSLKNLAALEFEAFRMLSFGFACSIGDQLEPGGVLNPATYRLIRKVYSQVAAREAWARPSVPLTDVAVLTGEDPLYDWRNDPYENLMGAVQVLEELAIQFDLVDAAMALDGYRLLIIPDGVTIDDACQQKINAFVAAGGRVFACGNGGLNAQNAYPACFGAQYGGETAAYPDFIIAQGQLGKQLEPENEYVIYQQGVQIAPNGGTVALSARAPYFKRAGDRFCSHSYTPSGKGEAYPAAIATANTLLFSHPLFTQYRQNAPGWVKQIIANAIDMLLPDRLVKHDGPSYLTVQVLDQPEQSRTCVHLLSYIPVRKSASIDIIEERTAACDVTLTLNLPKDFTQATLVPDNTPLQVEGNRVRIPRIDGYAIIELR